MRFNRSRWRWSQSRSCTLHGDGGLLPTSNTRRNSVSCLNMVLNHRRRLGKPFPFDAYLSALADLRDKLKAILSNSGDDVDGSSASDLAERIDAITAANTSSSQSASTRRPSVRRNRSRRGFGDAMNQHDTPMSQKIQPTSSPGICRSDLSSGVIAMTRTRDCRRFEATRWAGRFWPRRFWQNFSQPTWLSKERSVRVDLTDHRWKTEDEKRLKMSNVGCSACHRDGGR
jgi:hypothetical protein